MVLALRFCKVTFVLLPRLPTFQRRLHGALLMRLEAEARAFLTKIHRFCHGGAQGYWRVQHQDGKPQLLNETLSQYLDPRPGANPVSGFQSLLGDRGLGGGGACAESNIAPVLREALQEQISCATSKSHHRLLAPKSMTARNHAVMPVEGIAQAGIDTSLAADTFVVSLSLHSGPVPARKTISQRRASAVPHVIVATPPIKSTSTPPPPTSPALSSPTSLFSSPSFDLSDPSSALTSPSISYQMISTNVTTASCESDMSANQKTGVQALIQRFSDRPGRSREQHSRSESYGLQQGRETLQAGGGKTIFGSTTPKGSFHGRAIPKTTDQQSRHYLRSSQVHSIPITAAAAPILTECWRDTLSKSGPNMTTALKPCPDKVPARVCPEQSSVVETKEFMRRVEENTHAIMNRIFGQGRSALKGPRFDDSPSPKNASVGSARSLPSATTYTTYTSGGREASWTPPELSHSPRTIPETKVRKNTLFTAQQLDKCELKDAARPPWTLEDRPKPTATANSNSHHVRAIVAQLNGASTATRSPIHGGRENVPLGGQARTKLSSPPHVILEAEGAPSHIHRTLPNPSSLLTRHIHRPKPSVKTLQAFRESPVSGLDTLEGEKRLLHENDHPSDMKDEECSFIELIRVPTQRSTCSFRLKEPTLRTRSPLSIKEMRDEGLGLNSDSDDDNDESLQYLDVDPKYDCDVWLQKTLQDCCRSAD